MPRSSLLLLATTLLLSIAPQTSATTATTSASASCTNPIAGTWTLTFANLTANGTTILPYGENPRGFLFNMPTPDLTWIEEIDAPADAKTGAPPAQANAGFYEVDAGGRYRGRTTLTSTIASNVGISDSSEVLDFRREGNVLVQSFFPAPGVSITILWTRWVPGSTAYPSP